MVTDGSVDATGEAALELKKRARRRLMGASALALTAAIVLPMVMDREPRPPAQDIQVRIPSQDGGFASRIQPGKPTATPLPPADAAKAEGKSSTNKPEAAGEAPKAAAAASTAEAPKPAPAKAEPQKSETPKSEPVKNESAAKVETPKPETPADKPAEKPAKPEADNKKADEARAAAALSGGEQWVVQLGAYKEAGNVKLLMGKIKQMGLPAYTEHFDSPQGERTRVRAGPFASKEAAEKARVRIKTIGVDGPVAPK